MISFPQETEIVRLKEVINQLKLRLKEDSDKCEKTLDKKDAKINELLSNVTDLKNDKVSRNLCIFLPITVLKGRNIRVKFTSL